MRETEHREAGMPAPEARASARRQFGSVTLLKERARDAWTLPSFESWVQDARVAVRTLKRSPGFTIAATLTLALGIGATTIVFSVVDSLVLTPAPFTDPDRLTEIWRWSARGGGPFQPATTLLRWRQQSQLFQQVEGQWEASFVITGGEEPQLVYGSQVTVGLFRFLGVHPTMGRDFAADESMA